MSAKEKEQAAQSEGDYICHEKCFYGGRIYEVGDKLYGNAKPNDHFKPANVPLPEELPPVPPGKVRRVSPKADFDKGLNGIGE